MNVTDQSKDQSMTFNSNNFFATITIEINPISLIDVKPKWKITVSIEIIELYLGSNKIPTRLED